MLKKKKVPKKYNLSLSVPVDKYNACFGNPAKTFCNTPQNSAKNREKTSIIFFIHQIFHNKFMRALDRSFDKLVGTLEPKVRKTFACYLLSQIFQFFSNVFSSQSLFWTRAVRFWRSCHKTLFAINHENFRLVSGNELFFFHRIFSHEIFPLACKVQFWELSRNFYVEFLESFTELPHKKNKVLQKTFLHGMFHWTQRMLFWQPCRKLLAIYPKCFSPQSEIQFKKLFFKEKASQENNPAET